MRVPGLVISPYARRGYIDHQTLSADAYLKFIEDDFLHRQRLNPRTDGRPDPRPDVRETAKILGDLRKDFNFRQKPRRPLPLREWPVAPIPGKATGASAIGTVVGLGAGLARVQVTSTGPYDGNLLGRVIPSPWRSRHLPSSAAYCGSTRRSGSETRSSSSLLPGGPTATTSPPRSTT